MKTLRKPFKDAFYAYPVSVDVIRNAERPQILEMFRRMNAYTLPVNAAEKRQSDFFGEFKSWVNKTLDEYGVATRELAAGRSDRFQQEPF